jgi:hypothetical protein
LDQCAPLLDLLLDASDDTALAKVVLSFLTMHQVAGALTWRSSAMP